MTITFRPHHFLCALCFQGKGYSPHFIANFTAIMAKLNSTKGDATQIKIVKHTDSICHPCPHRSETTCTTEEKIAVLDRNHANALHIKEGEEITWKKAKQSIAEKISLALFHEICSTCQWKKLDICENALQKFLTTHL